MLAITADIYLMIFDFLWRLFIARDTWNNMSRSFCFEKNLYDGNNKSPNRFHVVQFKGILKRHEYDQRISACTPVVFLDNCIDSS